MSTPRKVYVENPSDVPYSDWTPPDIPPDEPLAVHRINAMWTQDELAEKAGVHRHTIMMIEAGKATRIRMETMLRISRALGLHPLQINEFMESWDERRQLARKRAEKKRAMRQSLKEKSAE